MRARLVLAAAVLAALALPAPAPGQITEARLARAHAIAIHHWGWPRPCAGEDIPIELEALPDGLDGWARWYEDPDGDRYGCSISLTTAHPFDWRRMCQVIVHEYGHLYGHDHVDDRRSVMHPAAIGPVAACQRAPARTRTRRPRRRGAKKVPRRPTAHAAIPRHSTPRS